MNTSHSLKRTLIGGGWFLLAGLTLYILYTLWQGAVADATWLPAQSVLLNLVLRGIPLALLVLALGLSLTVVKEEAEQGVMQPRVRRWLYWLPRISVVLFALLVSLFSLDVLGQGTPFLETVGAFLIHNIPTMLIILAIFVASRWEWVGGLLFIAWAFWYLFRAQGFPGDVYLIMSGLPFALGILFLLNWQYRTEVRASH